MNYLIARSPNNAHKGRAGVNQYLVEIDKPSGTAVLCYGGRTVYRTKQQDATDFRSYVAAAPDMAVALSNVSDPASLANAEWSMEDILRNAG
jgi:hypothetical protein